MTTSKSNDAIKKLLVKIKKAAAELNGMLDRYEELKLKQQVESIKIVKSKPAKKSKSVAKAKAKKAVVPRKIVKKPKKKK